MSQYDLQELALKRQRMIAQSLRESGNVAPEEVNRTAGGYVIPVSPWAAFSKVLQQGAGAYADYDAGKQEKALEAQKQDDAAQWMQGMGEQNQMDQLQPVIPTNPPLAGGDPAQLSSIMQQQGAAQDSAVQDATAGKNARMAQYMKGLQLGGVPAALSQQGLERAMTPKIYDPVKLGRGETLIDPNTNSVMARGEKFTYKPDSENDVTMNVREPKDPRGYKTIFRRDFKPEEMQEWIKPAENTTGSLTDSQESEAQKIAKMVHAYQIPMPSLNTRSPVPARVASLVGDMDNAWGEDYRAFEYNARSKALNSFSTGKQGQTVRSFNVMIDHMHTLENAFDKLNNGKLQTSNELKNWALKQLGDQRPTTVDSLRNMIRGELVKAVTGGPGAESDRIEALVEAASLRTSPAQMHEALSGLRELAASQLKGLKREFTTTTQLSDKRFDSYLSPAALDILNTLPENMGDPAAATGAATAGAAHPADIQAILDKYKKK